MGHFCLSAIIQLRVLQISLRIPDSRRCAPEITQSKRLDGNATFFSGLGCDLQIYIYHELVSPLYLPPV